MFTKFIKYLLKTISNNKNYDFSSFLPDTPPTHKQWLIEKCTKRGIPIYIDDHMEQCSSANAIFRTPASEAELEDRLRKKKANDIQIHILVATIVTLATSFL